MATTADLPHTNPQHQDTNKTHIKGKIQLW